MEKQEKPKDDFRYIVRIANTDLDGNRKISDTIRKIKGVSFAFANAICKSSGVDGNKKTGELTDADVKKIEDVFSNSATLFPQWLLNRRKSVEDTQPKHLITTDLTFANENDIRQMQRIRSYRGIRHMSGAPVRGQRTRSNFRRNKGKVMGVAKAKPSSKTGGK